ncbi:hypothetical protein GOODEAATRI_003049 [Goodea atripinnis]|uniref:Uncharacterized protein n=1 Tax=Goodea atripinnis TaxID=208336 RepID=A0ABV0NRE2_9TELE
MTARNLLFCSMLESTQFLDGGPPRVKATVTQCSVRPVGCQTIVQGITSGPRQTDRQTDEILDSRVVVLCGPQLQHQCLFSDLTCSTVKKYLPPSRDFFSFFFLFCHLNLLKH